MLVRVWLDVPTTLGKCEQCARFGTAPILPSMILFLGAMNRLMCVKFE